MRQQFCRGFLELHHNRTSEAVDTDPADGETEVAVGTDISATFSKDMNPATIDASTFTVNDDGPSRALITGAVSYDNKVATFDPASDLSTDHTYTACITTGVEDLLGNSMLVDYCWSFKTPDTIGPTVESTTPADEAEFVEPNANILVTFNEAMNQASMIVDNFTVTYDDATRDQTAVTATLTYDPATRTATFNPDSDLPLNTEFSATVSTGVTDAVGNPMAADYNWGFKTRFSNNDADGDGVPDEEDQTPMDATKCTPESAKTAQAISLDVSAAPGAAFSGVQTKSDVDPSVVQTGKPDPSEFDFPDGLVGFKIVGLDPRTRLPLPLP